MTFRIIHAVSAVILAVALAFMVVVDHRPWYFVLSFGAALAMMMVNIYLEGRRR